MTSNPNKKILILGIHPEFNSINTRTLKQQMEDPYILENPEEKLKLK